MCVFFLPLLWILATRASPACALQPACSSPAAASPPRLYAPDASHWSAVGPAQRLGPAFTLRLRGGARAAHPAAVHGCGNVADEDIVRLLSRMLAPDSTQIRTAEEELDEVVASHPFSCIEGLLACILREGAAIELRQLAAVLLRRRIGDIWGALSEEQQADVQLRLGDALVADLATASSKLRRLLALCVAAVASLSSSLMQLDTVVERILAAAAGIDCSPDAAAVAIETLEMLVESMAHDMHRHVEKVHETALAALQSSHTSVRLSSVRLSSSLLVHSFGRADAGFSGELAQQLHSLLVRAVGDSDAATTDCILVSLTEVVPFCWGIEACARTDQLVRLALDVMAQEGTALAVREHASLFVVELAQCQPHVLQERGLFGRLASRLTALACTALLHHLRASPASDFLMRMARGQDDALQRSDFSLGHSVREKRCDLLESGDSGKESGREGDDVMLRASSALEAEEEAGVMLRALRLVLQSDGAELATAAFARALDGLCPRRGKEHQMVRLVLVQACCEAAQACPSPWPSQLLHSLNLVCAP